MGNWLYRFIVIGFWVVAMGWLVTTKILPPFLSGTAPDYSQILPSEAKTEPIVHWDILWNETPIGSASTEVVRHEDGTGVISNHVLFEKLAVGDLMRQFLGGVGVLLQPALQIDSNLRIDVELTSKTTFDHFGELDRFDASVSIDGVEDLLLLRGVADQGKVKVHTRVGDPTMPVQQREVFKQTFDLPADRMVSDSLSPNSRLTRLKVGQKWNLHSYNPLSPTSPMQVIQARVESRELIPWDGEVVQANLVAYRPDAGTGLSTSRKPVGRMWVKRDGMVLKQEVVLGQGKVVFQRVPQSEVSSNEQ